MPPIARFYAAGVKVAVGTDSLASVGDLNLFAELHTMRWLAPSVPARTLLASATRVGAEALGLGDELGTIEVGKRAELIAVTLPATWAGRSAAQLPRTSATPRSRDGDPEHAGDSAGAFDIEEYLVGGITPEKVRWVSS
jgi:cytosine/adenosine deaminase-related metal-dependent hydrolase